MDSTPEPGALRRALSPAHHDLSEDQRQALIAQAVAWLDEKWMPGACPYCHHIEWDVGTPLNLVASDGTSMTPMFPVMCVNCGNTTFINAIRAGLFPEPEPEEAP
jgi:hypothetical protein